MILILTVLIGKGSTRWKRVWWKPRGHLSKSSILSLPFPKSTFLFISSTLMSCEQSQPLSFALSHHKKKANSLVFTSKWIIFLTTQIMVCLIIYDMTGSVLTTLTIPQEVLLLFYLWGWDWWATSDWLWKCSAWSLQPMLASCSMGHQQNTQDVWAHCCPPPVWQLSWHIPGALWLVHAAIPTMCILFMEGQGTGPTLQIDLCTSRCPNLVGKFLYTAASMEWTNSPCTNVPVTCPLCPSMSESVWKYNMRTHLMKNHPSVCDTDILKDYTVSRSEKAALKSWWDKCHKVKSHRKWCNVTQASTPLTISDVHSSCQALL